MQSTFREVHKLLEEMKYVINRLQINPHNKGQTPILDRLEDLEEYVDLIQEELELPRIKRLKGVFDNTSPRKIGPEKRERETM